jgi:hypothetical protein
VAVGDATVVLVLGRGEGSSSRWELILRINSEYATRTKDRGQRTEEWQFSSLMVRRPTCRAKDAIGSPRARTSSVQDNATLHTDPGFPITIGDNCVIGHNVVLHGCVIASNSLIGMGAIVLNGAKIGRNCLVGAGALVTEGKEFPDNSLIVGSPARALRTVDEKASEMILQGADIYVRRWRQYSKGLKRIG